VKYGENSLILTIYTEKYGRQSYIINSARNSRSKNKAGLMQPLFIVDIEVYEKKNRELQRIKEIRLSPPYLTIPFDIVKYSQALLLSEFLYKAIIEQEQNIELSRFLESSFLYFDTMENGKQDFHIWLLSHLTMYLGIMPDINSTSEGWLDMRKGTLAISEPPHPGYMNPEISSLFRHILQLKLENLEDLRISRSVRVQLLSKILEYYFLHFSSLKSLKSSEILKAVFQGD
jgi:DNA repair protein RecO (recombination protein O)